MNASNVRVKQTIYAAPAYTEAETRRWLEWLARGMTRHGQTVFLIEGLQLSWLETRRQLVYYVMLTRITLLGLIGLIGGTVFGLMVASELMDAIGKTEWVIAALVGGLRFGLAGCLVGLIIGLIEILQTFRLKLERASHRGGPRLWLKVTMLSILVLTPVLTLMFSGPGEQKYGLFFGSSVALIIGLLIGLIVRRIFDLDFAPIWLERDVKHTTEIGDSTEDYFRAVESVSWNWRDALRSGLGTGLLYGLWGVFAWKGSIRGFLAVFSIGFLHGCIKAITVGVVDMKTQPNQGIHMSIRNGFLMGSGAGVIIALTTLVFWTVIGGRLAANELAPFSVGVVGLGIIGGVGVGLWYGGQAAIKHYFLRIILYLSGDAPLHYARFLDYAANELNFLQKVGGGYVFIHRYLLEHFAGIDVGESAQLATGGSAEQTEFDVILEEVGANKIKVIWAVREINPNLGLKEAKDVVESAPIAIVQGATKAQADSARAILEVSGATVSIK